MKGDEDDDDSFGDFTFASFPNHSDAQFTTASATVDDDEWGDFLVSPLESTAPSHTQSQSSQPSQIFSDQMNSSSSVHKGVESGSHQWVKPKGALPLSLFGEEEVPEEESRSVSDLKVVPFSNKDGGNVKDLTKFQYVTGFDDIIANLYGETKQPDNGFSSKLGDSNLNLAVTKLGESVLKLTTNIHVRSHSDLFGNGFDSDLSKLGWNSYASSPNLQGQNSIGLSSNQQGFNGSASHLQELSLKGSISNIEGLDLVGSISNQQGLHANIHELSFNGANSYLQGLNANGSNLIVQRRNGNEKSSNVQGLDANGSSTNLQGLNSNGSSSNMQDVNTNVLTPNFQGLNASGSISNLQGFKANRSSPNLQGLYQQSGSNSNGQGWNFNGSSSNGQGWNFDASSLNTQVHDKKGSNSNLQGLNANGSTSNLEGLNSSFNGWNLNSGSVGKNEELEAAQHSESNSNKLVLVSDASNSNLSHLHWSLNELNSNLTTGAKEEIKNDDEDNDDDDDGWEFKAAYSEAKIGDGITTKIDVTSNANKVDSSFNGSISKSMSVSGNDSFDADDNGWGFKDAYSESKTTNGNDKVPVASESSGRQLDSKWDISREIQVDQKEHGTSEVTTHSSGFSHGVGGPMDLFSDLNGFSSKSKEEDTGLNMKSSEVGENGSLSYSLFQSDQSGLENNQYSNPPVQHADSDEGFGDFTAAFSQTELKHNEEANSRDISTSEVQVHTIDDKNKVYENNRGPVSLSIFGDEELEEINGNSSSIQDDFTFKPVSSHRNGQSQGSKFSLDNLFELYSQAEPINSVDESLQKEATENGSDSTQEVLRSNIMDAGNDLEGGSWDFKDAVSPTITKEETNMPTETKMNNYADFYCKLKDELGSVARYHIHNLKKAKNSAALSGEDAKMEALDQEIKVASEELDHENIIAEEANSEDVQPKDVSLKEFLQVLNEPEFQVLESAYNLSRRLPMAENDLKAAVELIRHAKAVLKIFDLVSLEEQSIYISTWSKMLSICAQELKHGASIWKQSLEKGIHSRIFSEPQGKKFIIALGEIYRVVAILGLSIRLYRPWTASNSTSVCNLLEECHTLWSSSGFEEALLTISDDPHGVEYTETANELSDSIKSINGLDAFDVGNCVFIQQQSLCRLSSLPPTVVPGMKMVVWDGDNYFLTLANLWANLISCNPPKLPSFEQFGC